jgi:hypothetical protein
MKPQIYKSRETKTWVLRWYQADGMHFVDAFSFEEICLRAKYILKCQTTN